ncbi:hypothetical protein HCN44_004528 [Aphidius gifuensis]|uniref:Uncharacterized protein n=1 Tax=Aphidius gifuensis TaxID=684658 RepID=A0A834Y1X2_APHGI|nr:uncharacterized protein LOC122848844 [Aphidius gifuensis]KAF7995056.1 hypothetical protein HCN44_004528 [Aphidius gifuensis]
MEIVSLKRKCSTRARVGKHRTLKKLRESFLHGNDEDNTNKSSDDRSTMSNSCEYISDNSDNQNIVSELIKLEPHINLDFLSEDGTFTNQGDYYDTSFDKQTLQSTSNKQLNSTKYIELKKWAIDHKIAEDALQELIDILRPIMPDIPKTVEEFLSEKINREPENEKNPVIMNGNEFQAIMEKLTSMQGDIREISNNQRNLEHLVRSNHFLISSESDQSFSDKYEVELPIKDVEKLFSFEALLAKNTQCRKDFQASLSFLLEDRLSRSSLGIIRKFMHRDVILKCTAVKQMEGKFVMRLDIPTFWHSIVDILMKYHKVAEKEVHAALGTVLTNAKDWDGNRAQRDKSSSGKSLQC